MASNIQLDIPGMIVSSCASKVVKAMIYAHIDTTQLTAFEKAQLTVGAFSLGGAAGAASWSWTQDQIKIITEVIREVKLQVEFTKRNSQT